MTIEEVLELVPKLVARIEELERRLEAVDSREENGFAGLDARCDRLSAGLSELCQRCFHLEDTIARVDYRVDGVQRDVASVEGVVSNLRHNVGGGYW